MSYQLQPRVESQFCFRIFCCEMRVTTAVTLLGLAGIIISFMDLFAGILAALYNYETVPHFHHSIFHPIFHSKFSFSILDEFIPYSLSRIIYIIPLIMNIKLIMRNSPRNFIGVRSVIRIICIFYFSFHLIDIVFFLWRVLFIITQVFITFKDLRNYFLVLGLVVFVYLAIYEPMNMKRIINVYINFNIVLAIPQAFILLLPLNNEDATEQIMVIAYSVYHIGYFIVFYNIVDVNVKDDQEMKPGTDRKQFNNIV